MFLKEIYSYPIKSTKGISLQSTEVERRGLAFDRRWMLVDQSGVFISQRTSPRLSLVATRFDADQLRVSVPGRKDLTIPTRYRNHRTLTVQVWDDAVQAVPVDGDADEWFSKFLGMPCRLVFMPDDCMRPVAPSYAVANDIVSFADAFPLLVISQASLDDLNARLDQPLPMNRFRPNLVVNGCEPYAEDNWKRVRINEIVFRLTKRCSRCVTTTIDQERGIAGKEPLATLSVYRRTDSSVFFGRNAVPEETGTVRVGDAVEIIEQMK